jgi:hypothetical protein
VAILDSAGLPATAGIVGYPVTLVSVENLAIQAFPENLGTLDSAG